MLKKGDTLVAEQFDEAISLVERVVGTTEPWSEETVDLIWDASAALDEVQEFSSGFIPVPWKFGQSLVSVARRFGRDGVDDQVLRPEVMATLVSMREWWSKERLAEVATDDVVRKISDVLEDRNKTFEEVASSVCTSNFGPRDREEAAKSGMWRLGLGILSGDPAELAYAWILLDYAYGGN